MTRLYAFSLMALTIVLVFISTAAWEFALEPVLPKSLPGYDEGESSLEKWKFVWTSTFAAIIAMALMVPVVARLAAQRDKSAHKALELEREKARFAKKSIQENSAFIASLSHEMRTPLNGIIGFSDMLITQEADSTKSSQLRLIQTSGQTLLRLINDLLDLSKIESGAFAIDVQEFRPFDLMRGIEEFWLKQVGENVALHIEVDKVIPEQLIGSEGRIEQILQNLISNAAKFTEVGHIRVTLGGQITQSGYLLSGTVEDTGPGMTEEFMGKMFDRFTQGDGGSQTGSGLGLAISKNLANLMGGDVTVASKLGQGTTFSFSILTQLKTSAAAVQSAA